MDELRIHIKVNSEHLDAAGVSDTGLFRDENQDSIYIDEGGRFALLADGMGGMTGEKRRVAPSLIYLMIFFNLIR
jgi:hypothetical protein